MEAGAGDMIRITASADQFKRFYPKTPSQEHIDEFLGTEVRVSWLHFNFRPTDYSGVECLLGVKYRERTGEEARAVIHPESVTHVMHRATRRTITSAPSNQLPVIASPVHVAQAETVSSPVTEPIPPQSAIKEENGQILAVNVVDPCSGEVGVEVIRIFIEALPEMSQRNKDILNEVIQSMFLVFC